MATTPTYQEILDSVKISIKDIIDGKSSQYSHSGRQLTRLSLSSLIETHSWAQSAKADEDGETWAVGKFDTVK